jgi:hypothetical protein
VQVRVQSSIGRKPFGPIISTGTLRLSGFGAPVHIARPALDPKRTALSVPIIGHASAVSCG